MLVLGKVSFDAKENGMTCLLGPSGCGKSTLLNVISGLEALDQGRVEIVSDKSDGAHVPRIGYVFQDPRLLNWKRVEGNMTFALKGMRVPESQWEGKNPRIFDSGRPDRISPTVSALPIGRHAPTSGARARPGH